MMYIQPMLSGWSGVRPVLGKGFLSDGAAQGDTEHILINAASSLQLG